MNPEEEAALEEVKKLLKLHFDAFVLTTRVSDDGKTDRINSDWHGSLSDVAGMHRFTGLRLDHIIIHGDI